MKKSIREVMCSLIAHDVTVASWGVSGITAGDGFIRFSVAGMKYRGLVMMESIRGDGEISVTLDGKPPFRCRPGDAVNLLDEAIEHSDDYPAKVAEWLSAI